MIFHIALRTPCQAPRAEKKTQGFGARKQVVGVENLTGNASKGFYQTGRAPKQSETYLYGGRIHVPPVQVKKPSISFNACTVHWRCPLYSVVSSSGLLLAILALKWWDFHDAWFSLGCYARQHVPCSTGLTQTTTFQGLTLPFTAQAWHEASGVWFQYSLILGLNIFCATLKPSTNWISPLDHKLCQ